MAGGDKTKKNDKIAKFRTDVTSLISADGTIKQRSDVNAAYQDQVPFVDKAKLVEAANPAAAAESIVDTRGGMLTASALADLFMTYGRVLSSVQTASIRIREVTPLLRTRNTYSSSSTYTGGGWTAARSVSSSTTTLTTWTNEVTALSAQYAMSSNDFYSAVVAKDSDVFDNLAPGRVNNPDADIDALIAAIAAVIVDRKATSSGVNVQIDDRVAMTCHTASCHTSCHTSCHGSRGRR